MNASLILKKDAKIDNEIKICQFYISKYTQSAFKYINRLNKYLFAFATCNLRMSIQFSDAFAIFHQLQFVCERSSILQKLRFEWWTQPLTYRPKEKKRKTQNRFTKRLLKNEVGSIAVNKQSEKEEESNRSQIGADNRKHTYTRSIKFETNGVLAIRNSRRWSCLNFFDEFCPI